MMIPTALTTPRYPSARRANVAAMSQTSFLPKLNPDDLIVQAVEENQPIARFCLFSGGNDSLVTAHRCRDHYDELVWLDTGTALPGVEEFVVESARRLGKPLQILRHEFDAFRLLVVGGIDWKGDEWTAHGFPGPPQHGRAYNRLKQFLLERHLRETKVGHPRSARVLYVTGKRRAESERRKNAPPINRKAAMVFVNPLIDWQREELDFYRAEHGLEQSDVAALLHRSGECNCGSFAAAGEREMLQSLFPEWWAERIAPLEAELEAMGSPCARWGEECSSVPSETVGFLCEGCEQLALPELSHVTSVPVRGNGYRGRG